MFKKIVLITLLATSYHQFCSAMETASAGQMEQKEDGNAPEPSLIQDIDFLRPYYCAIHQIRVVLEPIAKKFHCKMGLAVWTSP